MSQVEVLEPPGELVWVRVADLVPGPLFRDSGLSPDHVEQLVGSEGSWPPILVARSSGFVVDGAHRVAAARRLGLAQIEAVIFDGGTEEAFIEFVRRNVVHGLLLTLDERKRAAVRVLRAHRAWSDRRVAALCGISPKTVSRLRDEAGARPSEENPHVDDLTRVGRDNRTRPVQRGSVRARVMEALLAHPTGSLRAVAAVAGVSPETVRLVRMNLASAVEELPEVEAVDVPGDWRSDAALSSCERAEDFLTWFERTAVSERDDTRVGAVPLSRVYELADEARRRSDIWARFARALEARSTKAHSTTGDERPAAAVQRRP